jgi:hypothetical protein
MQHYFFDFLGDDENSAIARGLTLILSLLTGAWLTLKFLILRLRIWSLRARGLSRLTLRLLTLSLGCLRLVRCAWYLSGGCLVPASDGGGKKNNQ